LSGYVTATRKLLHQHPLYNVGTYLFTVLATLLWGLWFLYFPAFEYGKPLGLKIKHIITVIIISLIPIMNLIGILITFVWILVSIIITGISSVFPKYSGKKLDKFLNYEFFKTKS